MKCSYCGGEIKAGYVNAYASCEYCYPSVSADNLNEAQLLSIQRLSQRRTPWEDIADRIGVTIPVIEFVIKKKKWIS